MGATILDSFVRATKMLKLLLACVLAGIALQAGAQEDPPGRVASLSVAQGAISLLPAGDRNWLAAQPNRPLTVGDRLRTDALAWAELDVGAAALRMDERSTLVIAELDDLRLRAILERGVVQLHVREATQGQYLEIATGNLAFVITAPGDYRIGTDASAGIPGITEVAVERGSGIAYGENGDATALVAGQQSRFTGRRLEAAAGVPLPPSEAFVRWVAERNRQEALSASARHVPQEVVGYRQLDGHGDWIDDPVYGAVWFPRDVNQDWAPYSDGYWVSIAPWGRTWVDRAPWGFAPFHYGRWTRIGTRWCWVPPGRQTMRVAYAPALVGFAGGAAGRMHPAVRPGSGRPGAGWFPLAPGEAWRPGYRASPGYLDRINSFPMGHPPKGHMGQMGQMGQIPVQIPGPASRHGAVAWPQQGAPNLLPGPSAVPAPPRGPGPIHGLAGRRSAVPPPPVGMQAQQQEFLRRQQAEQHRAMRAQQQSRTQAAPFARQHEVQQQMARPPQPWPQARPRMRQDAVMPPQARPAPEMRGRPGKGAPGPSSAF